MEVIGGFDFIELIGFKKPHFRRLLEELQLPVFIEIHGRGGRGASRVPVELALGVTLWRLECPATLSRDRMMWGLPEATIAETFDLTIDAIYDRWGHLVHELQHEAILPKIDMFCEAIYDCGSPLDRCWGFIGGSTQPIDRPWRVQTPGRGSGRQRPIALKHQAIDTPDGIIRRLWGSDLGRRHDPALLEGRKLLLTLRQRFNDDKGTPYYLHRDPAYGLSPWLMTPYAGVLTPAKREFNEAMGSLREGDEDGFGKIVELWSSVDYAERREVDPSTPGLDKECAVAGILTNCHSCLYGNSTSKYFEVRTPSLRSYLQGQG
ncbi:unnamed protein product [Ectocarpus sp. 12 AP-2014]